MGRTVSKASLAIDAFSTPSGTQRPWKRRPQDTETTGERASERARNVGQQRRALLERAVIVERAVQSRLPRDQERPRRVDGQSGALEVWVATGEHHDVDDVLDLAERQTRSAELRVARHDACLDEPGADDVSISDRRGHDKNVSAPA